MLRPTAASVAQTLQDIIVGGAVHLEGQVKAQSVALRHETFNPLLVPEAIIKSALQLIQKAREVNQNSASLIPLKEKITTSDLNLLVSGDDSWEPVKYFVVGAVIWWGLTDAPIKEFEEDSLLSLPLNANGTLRALTFSYYIPVESFTALF
jgi:hypothetical protein